MIRPGPVATGLDNCGAIAPNAAAPKHSSPANG